MNKNQKKWTLFLGVVIALVVMISQLFWFQDFYTRKNTDRTEKQEQPAGTVVSMPSSSLPSASPTVEPAHTFSFLHEILPTKEAEATTQRQAVPLVSKFFRTLFRVFITPNAP